MREGREAKVSMVKAAFTRGRGLLTKEPLNRTTCEGGRGLCDCSASKSVHQKLVSYEIPERA